MRFLKYFESKKDIQIGDYIIGSLSDAEFFILKKKTNEGDEYMKDFCDFLENTIGEVVGIKLYNNDKSIMYMVQYDDMNDELIDEFENPTSITEYDILFSSSKKEDCEIYLISNKYNI